MNKRLVILAMAVGLTAGDAARADAIRKTDGKPLGNVNVVQMSAQEVTIEQGGASTTIPVNEIQTIRYAKEPSLLNTARTALEAGRNEDAVAALEKVNADDQRPEVQQDVLFCTALAKTRIALAGTDEEAVKEAGRLMAGFVKAHPNSYHYFEACELVGDALVATGNYPASQDFYGRVAKAPWPDYQMRAGVALGLALLAEGKTDEALKSFQGALDTQAEGESADRQRLAATLGKARCLTETGGGDEAVKLVEGVIEKADTEEALLHARAYNALGAAHRKAGRAKDALLAFLHVDLLYFTSPKEHIEALENLVELFEQVQQPERADEAAKILQERYKRNPRSD
ncbi:MAG: tetratricopeptide repeat protein [Planctomycetota bacterium]